MRALSKIKSVLLPLGLLIVGVLAIVVMASAGPTVKKPTLITANPREYTPLNGLDLVQSARDSFDANEANADSAPKQQVVAGWAAKDLLTAIAMQNAAAMNGVLAVNENLIELQSLQTNITDAIAAAAPPVDNRPRYLLALAVLALCWFGIWSVVPANLATKQPFATEATLGGASLPVPESPQQTVLPTTGSDAPWAGPSSSE